MSREPFTLGGTAVEVRELTVAEIIAWLDEVSSRQKKKVQQLLEGGEVSGAELVDRFLMGIEGVTMTDIVAMTNLSTEQLQAFTPGQLDALVAECKEVNKHFFALPVRRLEEAASFAAILRNFNSSLKLAPPSSSATGTPTSTATPGDASPSPLTS